MRPGSKLANWNLPEKIAFGAFLFWSAFGLFFTIQKISATTVASWPGPEPLHDFIGLCLHYGDPILILLAFINTHLLAVRQWSAGIARRWGLIVLVAAFLVESLGAITGFPFGSYHYTDRFGPVIGVVPLTIPLAWHVVVTNALMIVRAGVPTTSQLVEAALAGLLCTLYDFVLEPFASTVKQYWIWAGGAIPPLNYVAWFVLSALLVRFFAPTLSTRFRRDPRPWVVLGVTILIFIAGRAAG